MKKFHSNIYSSCCRLLTRISPRLNNQFVNLVFYHRFLNLKHPKTFQEKLVWLKLNRYIHDPLVKQCADKFAVREYIEKNGLNHLLVPLIASYNYVNDIKWEELPQQFAMKLNYGCGYNIICPDKSKKDFVEVKNQLNKWLKEKDYFYLNKAELQYKDVNLKIIVEQFLQPSKGNLPADYKVYCFNGEPRAILYMEDRGEDTKALFFDTKWNYISEPTNGRYTHHAELPERPSCLEEMLEDSRILAKPFPFVRVDYYYVNEKLYFGEMTFTPAGGLFASECLVDGKPMGELLDIGL